MKPTPTRMALFLGAIASAIAAGVLGALVLFLEAVATGRAQATLTRDAIEACFVFGLLFAAIGLVAAVLVGFPFLLALRSRGKLDFPSVIVAGAFAGFVASMIILSIDSIKPAVLPLGIGIGAASGAVALLVANAIARRGMLRQPHSDDS